MDDEKQKVDSKNITKSIDLNQASNISTSKINSDINKQSIQTHKERETITAQPLKDTNLRTIEASNSTIKIPLLSLSRKSSLVSISNKSEKQGELLSSSGVQLKSKQFINSSISNLKNLNQRYAKPESSCIRIISKPEQADNNLLYFSNRNVKNLQKINCYNAGKNNTLSKSTNLSTYKDNMQLRTGAPFHSTGKFIQISQHFRLFDRQIGDLKESIFSNAKRCLKLKISLQENRNRLKDYSNKTIQNTVRKLYELRKIIKENKPEINLANKVNEEVRELLMVEKNIKSEMDDLEFRVNHLENEVGYKLLGKNNYSFMKGGFFGELAPIKDNEDVTNTNEDNANLKKTTFGSDGVVNEGKKKLISDLDEYK